MKIISKNCSNVRACIVAVVAALGITACGGGDTPADQQPTEPRKSAQEASSKGAEQYQAKVSKQLNESFLNSMVRNWGISRKEAECLLQEHTMREIGSGAEKDPAIRAVFEGCGVDPAVVK